MFLHDNPNGLDRRWHRYFQGTRHKKEARTRSARISRRGFKLHIRRGDFDNEPTIRLTKIPSV